MNYYRGRPQGTMRNSRERGDPRKFASYTLAFWYRPGIGITIATGASQWNDNSGNARHLAQATGAAQPASTDSHASFGGTPVLEFTGAEFMSASWTTIDQPFSYVLACRFTNTPSKCVIDSVSANMGFQVVGNTSGQMFAGAIASPTLASVASTTNVFVLRYNSTSSSIRQNAAETSGLDTGTNGNTGLNLGRIRTGINLFIGQVSELIGFASDLPVDISSRVAKRIGSYIGVAA